MTGSDCSIRYSDCSIRVYRSIITYYAGIMLDPFGYLLCFYIAETLVGENTGEFGKLLANFQ